MAILCYFHRLKSTQLPLKLLLSILTLSRVRKDCTDTTQATNAGPKNGAANSTCGSGASEEKHGSGRESKAGSMTSWIRQTGGSRRPRSLSVAVPIQRDVEVSFTRQNATKLNITPLSRRKTIVTMKFSAVSVLALAASASAFAPAPQGNVSLLNRR